MKKAPDSLLNSAHVLSLSLPKREAERQHMPRIKALDNLLKQYAGTHYQYDAR
ncbi:MULTISPECIES: hypothetical protein [Burkholderia]|uniref:Uncharacterized protein n=2 Tax=Burkholderia TaxID=32008 RepID=A0A8I1DR23_BURCE|nr:MULTISPECIES: hypothetical protein [Burkholderia]MBH9685349.1 hypothetical protein [Burkholderia cepacia]MBH9700136.1 hypothetical protein [Burkholderia cepacia]MBH9716307.1 hypothetical protein [Burkholderia cepacia]MBH9736394.1 hypothetical protein [Burkholderia cepacia]MBX3762108.1 hypothetical protein [Burkholderia cepacia]